MISDTLFDAVAEIDRYLSDPAFASAYADPALRAEIGRVRDAMQALRERLDEAPGASPAAHQPAHTHFGEVFVLDCPGCPRADPGPEAS